MGENLLFSGRGKVFVADHGSTKFRWLGNCTGLNIGHAEEKTEHREMYSGNDLIDQTLRRRRRTTVSAVLESYSLANLVLAVHGEAATINSGSASAEAFPTGLVVGDVVELLHPKVSDVVLTDSAVTPATLTANTHYQLNANHGSVEILNLASFTQPFKAAYNYASVVGTGFLTKTTKTVVLRFEGLNVAVDDGTPDPVLVRLYKVTLDPATDLPLIQDEYGNYTLTGDALLDSTKSATGALGQVGEIFHLS